MREIRDTETEPRKGHAIRKSVAAIAVLAAVGYVDYREDGGFMSSARERFDRRSITLPGGMIPDGPGTSSHPAFSPELAGNAALLKSIPSAKHFSLFEPWKISPRPEVALDEGLRKITIARDNDKADDEICELVHTERHNGPETALYAWTDYADSKGGPLADTVNIYKLGNLIAFCVDQATFATAPSKPTVVVDIR